MRAAIDPRSLDVGIAHIGIGAFHRAHEAVYTEDAMAATGDRGWAICGISPRGSLASERLRRQDGLYSVLEHRAANSGRVIGSVRQVLTGRDDQAQIVAVLAHPSTRIVSLTVTEAGYLETAGVIGLLCRGLAQRKRSGGGPVAVLCCDNIPRNGEFVRSRMLVSPAVDRWLRDWIDANVTFPSCVVDRIVPATTSRDVADAARLIGLRDECPVACETYGQWVIEDDFVAGRPAWERAGVSFAENVEPYQVAKLRMLNGVHSALAYLGALAGYEFIADVLADQTGHAYARRLLDEEVIPSLAAPPGVDLGAYGRTVIDRLGAPPLRHRCLQVASDGTQKLPIRLLPTLVLRRSAGLPAPLTILAIAAWMRCVSGRQSDSGSPLHLTDPRLETVRDLLRTAEDPPSVVDRLLSFAEMFEDEVRGDRAVRDELVSWLALLSRLGAARTLAIALDLDD